ncbi:MAG: hypothetical protein J6S61_04375 [Elusimicrobiaceae bacterium]|nr:hypothetical protein [Elusimicrobiaceae bacterium]
MKKIFVLLALLIFSFPAFSQSQGIDNDFWAPKNLVEVMGVNGKYDKFIQTLSEEEVAVLTEGQEVVRRYLGYIKDIELYDGNKQLNFNSANLMFEYLDTIKDSYESMKMSYPNSGKAFGAWITTQIITTADSAYLGPLYLMFMAAGNMFMELGETERALSFVNMSHSIESDYDSLLVK